MSDDLILRTWAGRGPLACLLWPVSALMGGIVRLRRLAYSRGWLVSHRLPVPVVVIGNRIVGGAGKTPTTIAILEHLRAAGWRPGVLTRGYKARRTDNTPLLLDAQTAAGLDATATGDEPLLIWRRTGVPLMIGPDRVADGRALLSAHPEIDILVCDDGLQHLRLRRDIEVVVFDERGVGNGWLMPAGPLREPWQTQPALPLVAPPLVLYNADRPTTPLSGQRAQRQLGLPVALAAWWHHQNGPCLSPTAAGVAVAAMAGIAQPERFFDALRKLGFQVQPIPLADHAHFDSLPWPDSVQDLVVTEKDAVKLDPLRVARDRPGTRIWVAGLDFHPEPPFWRALDEALSRLPARPASPH